MSKRRNNDDIDNTKFFSAFTQSILNSDRSIRWVGITEFIKLKQRLFEVLK